MNRGKALRQSIPPSSECTVDNPRMRTPRLGGRAQGRHARPANEQEAEYTRARTTDVASYCEVTDCSPAPSRRTFMHVPHPILQPHVDSARYAKVVKVSKRIRWDIDRDVIREREFDFTK